MMKNKERNYNFIENSSNKIIRAWNNGVPFEDGVYEQAKECISMPFVHAVCLMPDAHVGLGSTVGSVIVSQDAVIPSAVGVDLGCGMRAFKTDLFLSDIVGFEDKIYNLLNKRVPNGRSDNGGKNDIGRWKVKNDIVSKEWSKLEDEYESLSERYSCMKGGNGTSWEHLGTLGTGNHFLEVCFDENQSVWVLVHSGSRGVGARTGNYFMRQAKDLCSQWFIDLPNKDLSYFPRGTEEYKGYLNSARWCQRFAFSSRKVMIENAVLAIEEALGKSINKDFTFDCHHNYLDIENHNDKNYIVIRKGAIRARESDWCLIPGSMGAKSYVAVGKGNEDSFTSCSHGAGRVMSRMKAKREISLEDHKKDTEGVFCDKTSEVIDESPRAYKNIDNVIEAEKDLIEVENILKQVICVKGKESKERRK
jgi:tRNA-splicing ligase RtcB